MNVDNQTILHLKAGHLPPEKLVALIAGKKPTAFGFSVQEAEGAAMQIMQGGAEDFDPEVFKQFLEDRKERPTSVYFGMLKEPYAEEDRQPYTIDDNDGNTFISLYCEGDIIGNTDPAAHTEQFNFVNGVIIPKILDWCSDFDGDIQKIMAKINGDVFKKDVLTHIGHRGILHILPFEGEPALLGKFGDVGIKADWGWSTQHHGFSAEEKAEEVAAPAKRSWGYGNKKAAAEAAPKEEKLPDGVHRVGATTVKKNDDKPQDVATPGTAPRNADTPVPIFVRPPDWLHKNQDVIDFYLIVNGQKHPGWKKKLPTEVKQNHGILQCKNLDEYNKWKLANLKDALETSSAPMANNAAKPQTKAERVAAQAGTKISSAPKSEHGPVDPTALPIIEAKDLEKVLEFVAQHLDTNSREIMPPQKMQELEAKLPTFSECVGVKLEEMLNWPVSGLFALAATDPRAMVLWGLEWRKYARQYLLAELKAKAKDGVSTTIDNKGTKTTTTDLGNGSKKVESVAAPAAAAPAKKSWGYKKVA